MTKRTNSRSFVAINHRNSKLHIMSPNNIKTHDPRTVKRPLEPSYKTLLLQQLHKELLGPK